MSVDSFGADSDLFVSHIVSNSGDLEDVKEKQKLYAPQVNEEFRSLVTGDSWVLCKLGVFVVTDESNKKFFVNDSWQNIVKDYGPMVR